MNSEDMNKMTIGSDPYNMIDGRQFWAHNHNQNIGNLKIINFKYKNTVLPYKNENNNIA